MFHQIDGLPYVRTHSTCTSVFGCDHAVPWAGFAGGMLPSGWRHPFPPADASWPEMNYLYTNSSDAPVQVKVDTCTRPAGATTGPGGTEHADTVIFVLTWGEAARAAAAASAASWSTSTPTYFAALYDDSVTPGSQPQFVAGNVDHGSDNTGWIPGDECTGSAVCPPGTPTFKSCTRFTAAPGESHMIVVGSYYPFAPPSWYEGDENPQGEYVIAVTGS